MAGICSPGFERFYLDFIFVLIKIFAFKNILLKYPGLRDLRENRRLEEVKTVKVDLQSSEDTFF